MLPVPETEKIGKALGAFLGVHAYMMMDGRIQDLLCPVLCNRKFARNVQICTLFRRSLLENSLTKRKKEA